MKTLATATLCLFAAAALTAGLSTSAHAQSKNTRGPGWDFGADVIYQDSTDITFEGGSTASLEDDIGVALTFGYRFNDHIELAFALDWQQLDYDATLQSGLVPNVSIDVSGDMETFTPRVWANYNFMDGPITPFVNAGIGWSFVDTNIPTSRVEVGCWWDPWWGYICTPYQSTKSIDDFVYQLGVGGRWDFANGFTLRLAYEKHWFDYSKATSTPDFDQIKLGLSFRY
jgi:opacity protein-like surface antigen